jgi:hypothetical protein
MGAAHQVAALSYEHPIVNLVYQGIVEFHPEALPD